MKKTTFILFSLFLCLTAGAQVSRRTALRLAEESVNQITMTGYMPSAEVMGQLASVADMSIDMISRMGNPDDPAQAKACMETCTRVICCPERFGTMNAGNQQLMQLAQKQGKLFNHKRGL